MKTPIRQIAMALNLTVAFASCKKSDTTATTNTSASSDYIAVATQPPATVASSGTSSSTSRTTDSVYLVQRCRRDDSRDTIGIADLPAITGIYIAANYGGAVVSKAFVLKNSAGTVTGYVVVLYYNNNPVGLLFDAAGAFVRVLEQRERGDLDGAGWHHGGRFEHRDGHCGDTIALSGLPASITSYFSANYPTDTLVKAFRNRDSSTVVISKNGTLFATTFTASGNFITRMQLPARPGRPQQIDLSAVPTTAASYLAQTYPNYVFGKAFVLSNNGTTTGYLVLIEANSTRYAVLFDASGNFLQARTIH